jgi:hypothetical protein
VYAPSGGMAWILHIVFYWSLLVTVVAPLSVLAEGDAPLALMVAVIWLFFLAGLGWLAWLIDSTGGTPRPRSRLQRALLLYWPAGVSARALHVLFYTLAPIVVAGLIGTAVDWKTDPESGELLIGILGCGAFAAVIRAVARRIDRATSEESDALPDPPNAQAATAK